MSRKRKRPGTGKPKLAVAQILAWADFFHTRTGRWPRERDGVVAGSLGETWRRVDSALRIGLRGLPGGTSLARLLAEQRGKYYLGKRPPLKVKDILAWADTHYRATGRWPHAKLGVIAAAPGETWDAVDMALRNGNRGLPKDTTLARLLTEHRGKRNMANLPRLTRRRILAWADAHYRRTGRWPHVLAGPIAEAPGESWHAVNQALYLGCRGFPGGSSLALLLADKRGKRHLHYLPRLTLARIVALADEYFREHGAWPKHNSGPVQDAAGGTWRGIDTALTKGCRGLPGGSSLAQVLAKKRGVRNQAALPALNKQEILAWAKAHFRRTGFWPRATSGPVLDASGETWAGINAALVHGYRGLPGGISLCQFLARHTSQP
jgi:hypothetical protein